MGKRTPRPIRRVTSDRRKFTIQIFAEGEKTEVQYLQAWHRRYREHVILTFDEASGGSGPMQLVDRAVSVKAKSEREERRGRGRAPDSYWCVFDVDEHPHIPEALATALKHGIQVAVSSPCIEVWLLLHYVDHRRWDYRWDVQSALKSAAGIDKTLAAGHLDHLFENYECARSRALDLGAMHDRNESEDRNPSSNLYQLIDLIRDAAGQS